MRQGELGEVGGGEGQEEEGRGGTDPFAYLEKAIDTPGKRTQAALLTVGVLGPMTPPPATQAAKEARIAQKRLTRLLCLVTWDLPPPLRNQDTPTPPSRELGA